MFPYSTLRSHQLGEAPITKEVTYPLRATGKECSKEQNQYLRIERRPNWDRDQVVALLLYRDVSPESLNSDKRLLSIERRRSAVGAEPFTAYYIRNSLSRE